MAIIVPCSSYLLWHFQRDFHDSVSFWLHSFVRFAIFDVVFVFSDSMSNKRVRVRVEVQWNGMRSPESDHYLVKF